MALIFRFRVNRLSNIPKGFEEKRVERAWAAIRATREMLAEIPCPDTFLGRKTQEPFPSEVDS